jgi:hypothetical protein
LYRAAHVDGVSVRRGYHIAMAVHALDEAPRDNGAVAVAVAAQVAAVDLMAVAVTQTRHA